MPSAQIRAPHIGVPAPVLEPALTLLPLLLALEPPPVLELELLLVPAPVLEPASGHS